ncbi:hypothetical protein F7725_008873, partial [Dissostichus mawsoni]
TVPSRGVPGGHRGVSRNKYFSHFAVYYGEKDGVPYVAHLTCRDSDSKMLLFGRALRSEIKLDPLELWGRNTRDFHSVVKPAIDELMGREVTFDILFHNSEHQATLLRYGVKKSQQIERIYEHIMPSWKKLFEQKKLVSESQEIRILLVSAGRSIWIQCPHSSMCPRFSSASVSMQPRGICSGRPTNRPPGTPRPPYYGCKCRWFTWRRGGLPEPLHVQSQNPEASGRHGRDLQQRQSVVQVFHQDGLHPTPSAAFTPSSSASSHTA